MNINYNEQLNLNYLRVFDAIYSLRNTQKAAAALGISQSAVSQTLAKIRDYTGDRLFYSSGATLHATHRADTIGQGLRKQIENLDHCLTGDIFSDPKAFSGDFTIAVSSVFLDALATELTSSIIFNLFPNARFNITIWDEETPQKIIDGHIQLGLNFSPLDTPKSIRSVPITISKPLIISRKNHPINKQALSVDQCKPFPTGSILLPGLPDYGAALKRNHPDVFNFQYRSASMSVLTNLVLHSDLLVLTENLASSLNNEDIEYHDPSWLQSCLSSEYYHAAYYLEKNHNTPFFNECLKAIKSSLTQKLKINHK